MTHGAKHKLTGRRSLHLERCERRVLLSATAADLSSATTDTGEGNDYLQTSGIGQVPIDPDSTIVSVGSTNVTASTSSLVATPFDPSLRRPALAGTSGLFVIDVLSGVGEPLRFNLSHASTGQAVTFASHDSAENQSLSASLIDTQVRYDAASSFVLSTEASFFAGVSLTNVDNNFAITSEFGTPGWITNQLEAGGLDLDIDPGPLGFVEVAIPVELQAAEVIDRAAALAFDIEHPAQPVALIRSIAREPIADMEIPALQRSQTLLRLADSSTHARPAGAIDLAALLVEAEESEAPVTEILATNLPSVVDEKIDKEESPQESARDKALAVESWARTLPTPPIVRPNASASGSVESDPSSAEPTDRTSDFDGFEGAAVDDRSFPALRQDPPQRVGSLLTSLSMGALVWVARRQWKGVRSGCEDRPRREAPFRGRTL